MFFQIAVNSRRKFAKAFGGSGLRLPRERLQSFSTPLVFIAAVSNRRRGFPLHILDPSLLPFLQHGHESIDAVQTARKTAVRIHLHENVFDLVHGEAAMSPLFRVVRKGSRSPVAVK